MVQKRFFPICIFFFPLLLYSYSQSGVLRGIVRDAGTGRPIPDANVFVRETGHGAATGGGGFFFIPQLREGTYHLVISVIGYRQEVREITLSGSHFIEVALTPEAVWTEPVVVSATRGDHLRSEVPASVEVLTYDALQALGGATPGEALAAVGGLYLGATDQLAGVATLRLRGAQTEHTLVLLDEVPLNTAQGGGVDLNLFYAPFFERVELVRGGHSALYGSGAVGGVVHLVTREAPHGGYVYGIRSQVGSFGMAAGSAYGGGEIGPASWLIQYGHLASEGDFPYRDPATHALHKRENNDVVSNHVDIKVRYTPHGRYAVRAGFQAVEAQRGVAGSLRYPSPRARRAESLRLFSIRTEGQWSDRLRTRGLGYVGFSSQHYRDPGAWIPEDDRHQNRATGIELQALYGFRPSARLMMEVVLRRDALESTRFPHRTRDTQSFLLQSELTRAWKWGLFRLIPALRQEALSGMGGHLSPRLGFLCALGQARTLVIRGNVAHGYRAPSFNDLYWPADFFSRGNPDLRPETSRHYDLGIAFQKRGDLAFSWESTFFRGDYRGLIQWVPSPEGLWMPTNVGKARTRGIETAAMWRLSDDRLSLRVAHTWLEARDWTPESPYQGRWLIYRPRHKWDLRAGVTWAGFFAHADWRFVRGLYTDPANTRRLRPYSLLHGQIGRTFRIGGHALTIRMEGMNLLDREVVIIEDYPTPGRELRLSVEFDR